MVYEHNKDNLSNILCFKILSLLLCCAVQGENVSECIDNITSLEEKLQFQLKIIIEAVLKDLDNGKIDPANLTDVLCQSGNITWLNISVFICIMNL